MGLSYVVEGGDMLMGWVMVVMILFGMLMMVMVNDVVDILVVVVRWFLCVWVVSVL